MTTKMRSLDRAARESSDDQVSWDPQRQEATEFTVARHSLFLEEDSEVSEAEKDPMAWDKLAEAAGVEIGRPGYERVGARLLGFERPFGPRREPSERCESGKRPYCTCDTCF